MTGRHTWVRPATADTAPIKISGTHNDTRARVLIAIGSVCVGIIIGATSLYLLEPTAPTVETTVVKLQPAVTVTAMTKVTVTAHPDGTDRGASYLTTVWLLETSSM